jgi:uncharacterized membrane protein
MKYFVSVIANALFLGLSLAGLLSTCMWGCPNTGIQLVFKISSICLLVSLSLIIYRWVTSRRGGETSNEG